MKNIKTKNKLSPTQIIVIGFAIVICIGTILLSLPIASNDRNSTGILDALFTATSAVCVTGLVVRDTATQWSIFGQIIILLLIQIGGLGFMTFGTLFAFVVNKKITYNERVIMQESLNQIHVSGIVKLAKYILILTFTVELIGAFILSFRFIPLLGYKKGIGYSIFHSISAFCNAGFDLMGSVTGPFSSLTMFNNDLLFNLTLMILIIIGGLGFKVIMELIQKKQTRKLSLYSKMVLRITGILLVVGFLTTLVLEFFNNKTLGGFATVDKLLPSVFLSVTSRTAGFNTIDTASLTTATIFLIIILMFIGGSSGSTAGGVKTSTIGVIFALIKSVLKGEDDAKMFKRKIPMNIVKKAVTIIGLGLSLIIFVTMMLSITEPSFQFKEILFEVVSAFGTVGLSLGITPLLSSVGKVLIILTMFFGRVGPLTIFLAITFKKKPSNVKYPEEKIIVG